MGGRPQNTRTEIQIACADHGHSQSACALIRQCDSDGGLCVIANSESAAVAPVAVVLVEIQEHALPITGELVARTDAPVVILDLCAKLGNHPLDADGTDVPSEPRFLKLLNPLFMMCRGNLSAASIERSSLVRCNQATDFFDERRERSFAVGCNRKVYLRIVSVVVDVAALR